MKSNSQFNLLPSGFLQSRKLSLLSMACTTQYMISANSCVFPSQRFLGRNPQRAKCGSTRIFFSATASSSSPDESDCNDEECAPDKEVGKVSVDWLASERTKVVGTFPPRNRGWTGYVEKDTAGQTNIYSVEPAVYVAESVISSGTAGTSADGAGNTLAVTGVLALVSIAAASTILIQVGKNQPPVPTVDYSGPPLGYYINKFKSVPIVEASVRPAPQTSSTVEALVPLEFSSFSSVEASIAPQSQIANPQEARKQEVVPEVQVGLREAVVDARSTSASIVS